MGFLKEFKDDFSQAANELIPSRESTGNVVSDEPTAKVPMVLTQDKNQEKRELPPVEDEIAVITNGTIIKGDVFANGSLEVLGAVYGNINCRGRLVITGTVKGDSNAAEIYTDAARIEGEIACIGAVKIGEGSVIIGNISSTSAVIAGAMRGDIDVLGPVVVESTAVVKGNIKARYVQINNGAEVDGFCSQAYADVRR
ncbi:MAG: polymer-forming cytoskeletal protein [Roseburia sp.]|nr:polymer-forming cytoskeletal protein [Roseburia sp.]